MKLETEFRLRLQLHQLLEAPSDLRQRDRLDQPGRVSTSTWVTISQAKLPVWSDEALLLCQTSEYEWIAWVPDYGEITLDIDSFNF